MCYKISESKLGPSFIAACLFYGIKNEIYAGLVPDFVWGGA